MKLQQFAAVFTALFGLFCCFELSGICNDTRQELKDAQQELVKLKSEKTKILASKIKVKDQDFPEILIGQSNAPAQCSLVKGKRQCGPVKTKAVAEKPKTLASRNNNPMNVKTPGKKRWKGQIGQDKFGHAVFETEEHGLRAGAMVLRAYAQKHKIATVEELVKRFAEANHEGYINHLCSKLKVNRKEKIDLVARLPEIMRVMVKQESGKDIPEHLLVPYDVAALVSQS